MNTWFKNVFAGTRGTVSVNGRTYTGREIRVTDKGVFVDGVKADDTPVAPRLDIVVQGPVQTLETVSGDVTVQGDVSGSVTTMSGDVTVSGRVGGSVSTMSGDVRAGDIAGSASSMSGDIRR